MTYLGDPVQQRLADLLGPVGGVVPLVQTPPRGPFPDSVGEEPTVEVLQGYNDAIAEDPLSAVRYPLLVDTRLAASSLSFGFLRHRPKR